MNGSSETKTPDLWSDYWRSGQLHACTFDFPEDAREAIAARWRKEFSALPSGATILDVATGSGALIALAAEVAGPDRHLSATGVDLAEIDQLKDTGLTASAEFDITFLGGTDAARLPFEDRQFTLVVSQFGLEYADFESAMNEACRVAKAKIVALMHAAESPVVRQNGLIPGQVHWLRSELALFDAAREHFQKATDKTGNRLTEISAAIRKKCASLENPDFLVSVSKYVGQLLGRSATLGSGQGLAFLDAMEAQLVIHADLMTALIEAARSEADLALARDICAAAGYNSVNVSGEYFGREPQLVGHWLSAEREPHD
ncbi:MAG: methyltransferase domain-containing protein [Proteobacteria bacterium]|nr:methyltransferase domain-containing protein [Pseudomonadota bacterium]